MDVVIASHNLHKIREFREMLKKFRSFEVLSLLNFPEFQALPEVGKTFQDNATEKAIHAAKTLNMWALADDSGLVVPALMGAPGVQSRRYSGEEASDAENRRTLLHAMEGMEGLQRTAYFECCLVLASPQGVKKVVTGTCYGAILREERGRNGFGYDSVFVKDEYDKTFGEIDEATKNRISHRRKAIEKLSSTLEMLLP